MQLGFRAFHRAKFLRFCLLLAPLHASAGAPVCLDISAVEEPTNCDDNEALGNEALSCVRKYYNYVQASQMEILAKFEAEIAKMKDEQSDTYNRSQSGYDETRKKLDALINDGQAARAAVNSLSDNLMFPEDYDQPAFTGMSKEQYLATEDCYAVPTRVMNQSKAMIDKIMNDLSSVEQTALGKENKSQNRSAEVQIIVPNQMAAKTKGKGAGDFAKKKFREPASDITGTDRPRTDLLPKEEPAKK